MPTARAIAAKSGFFRSQPTSRKPDVFIFISSSTKPGVPLFDRQAGRLACTSIGNAPIIIAKPPSPDIETTRRFGNAACAPIACSNAFAIDSWLNEPSSRRRPFIFR